MFAVGLVYAGFLVAVIGLISLVKPLTVLRIRSRRQARRSSRGRRGARHRRSAVPGARRNDDRHAADPTRCVRSRVPSFTRSTDSDRGFPRTGVRRDQGVTQPTRFLFFRGADLDPAVGSCLPEGILNAPGQQPILDVAARTAFMLLAEEPGQRSSSAPRSACRAAGGRRRSPRRRTSKPRSRTGLRAARRSTSGSKRPTRRPASSPRKPACTRPTPRRRMFAPYWRVIYPGSAWIRRMWLRAIKIRAEATADRQSGSFPSTSVAPGWIWSTRQSIHPPASSSTTRVGQPKFALRGERRRGSAADASCADRAIACAVVAIERQ